MAEIDFNQIYDGITRTLHRFYPDARIHGGEVKQDLQDGDFNVLPITANHTEQMGTRALRKLTFDVIYYASKAGGRSECLQVADQLSEILHTIQTPNGDKVHCLSFETTIDDDVLHCIASFPHFVYKPNESDSMNYLKIE